MVRDALVGLAVGDALGVPVEFKARHILEADPVVDMREYGSHRQPVGTWSDDSSLTFCLAETLAKGFSLNALADSFIHWYYDSYWTANGNVFDIGHGTLRAIRLLKEGCDPVFAGGMGENDNGNGSLMRILPLVFYIRNLPANDRFETVKAVSSLTHGHIRSIIACYYYLEFARLLINGKSKEAAFQELKITTPDFLRELNISEKEINIFHRLFELDISTLPKEQIYSSGYSIHTLEASIWCIMTTNSYKEAVLLAVNLGEDTDTTGAVTGGLAGMLYGYKSIPPEWLAELKQLKEIEQLADRLARSTDFK